VQAQKLSPACMNAVLVADLSKEWILLVNVRAISTKGSTQIEKVM
jgi:hypothetical protein